MVAPSRHPDHVSASSFRNFVFGVEDSLVSTVGLLAGITIANVGQRDIVVSGIVLIFVEAFSMAVGSFLSESAAEEYVHRKRVSLARPLRDSAVMFVSYFLSGFIPLLPYILTPLNQAFGFSITLSLVALFVLGAIEAKLARLDILRSGMRMLFIGGIAVLGGIGIGRLIWRF